MPILQEKMSIKKIASSIVAAIALISSVIGVWVMFDNKIDESTQSAKNEVIKEIQTSITIITKEIVAADNRLVDSIRDIMVMRIQTKRIEIDSYVESGQPVPVQLKMELQTFEDMLKELERKWHIK